MEEVESSFNTTLSNQGFNNAPALQLRLDSTRNIEEIEMFLKGEQIIAYETDSGSIVHQRKVTGRPKANLQGCQSILNFVSSIINPSVVQGNFPSEGKGISQMYDMYIEETNIDLVKMLVLNLYEWNVREEDVEEICDFIMKLVIPFVTRLIDNKERESYASTMQYRESNTVSDKGNRMQIFGR